MKVDQAEEKPGERETARVPEERSDTVSEVLLLGAGYTTSNMGVWALASSAVTSACHQYPEARIRILDYFHEPQNYKVRRKGGTSEVELLNIRFSKKVFLKNNIARLILAAVVWRLIPVAGVRERILAAHPRLRAVSSADIVGSIAGGDSFSDIYGMGRLIYVVLPQVLVLLMRRPLVLLPQTYGPFKRGVAKAMASWVIKRAGRVVARDQESLRIARDLGAAEATSFFCPDMAFCLEPVRPRSIPAGFETARGAGAPLVGLNVSGLLYMGGYAGDNMFGLKSDYPELVEALIRTFVEAGASVLLVPHVYGAGSGSESDASVSRRIHETLTPEFGERLLCAEDELSHHEVKWLIGQCDFFLGARMHACIGALSQRVPAVGLAYSRKFAGVFQSVDVEDLVADLRALGPKEVCELAMAAFVRRADYENRLEQAVPKAKARILSLFALN